MFIILIAVEDTPLPFRLFECEVKGGKIRRGTVQLRERKVRCVYQSCVQIFSDV